MAPNRSTSPWILRLFLCVWLLSDSFVSTQDFHWSEQTPLNQRIAGQPTETFESFLNPSDQVRTKRSPGGEGNGDDDSITEKDISLSRLIVELCSDEIRANITVPQPQLNSNKTTVLPTTPSVKEVVLCQLLKKVAKMKVKGQSQDGDQYLPSNYNKYEVPKIRYTVKLPNGKRAKVEEPVECQVFLNVRGIVNFDEENGLIKLDMDVILIWTDGNILNQYSSQDQLKTAETEDVPVVLSPIFLKKLWTPDIYIEEVMSLDQPTFMGNSVTVVLHPKTGVVVYRSRVLANLNCNLDFKYYPADTQDCTFTLKSFSYTTQRMTLSWILQGGTGVYLHGISDPNFDYQISDFTSNETFLDIGPASDPSTLYSSLQFTLKARRKMTYQLVQTYFASMFFVIVTWLCFLISPDMFEVRVGIAMSTLLTLTAMFSSVRDETPKVSYVKAIDTWMVCSIIFIFTALAGFTITAWIKRGLHRLKGNKDDDDSVSDILQYKDQRVLTERQTEKKLKRYRYAAIAIERFGVYILSCAYILFNIFYWTYLMHYSNYMGWNVNSTFNKMDD